MNRIEFAIFLGVVFVSLGYFIPALYDQYAPINAFYRINEFSAKDVCLGDTTHPLQVNLSVYKTIPIHAVREVLQGNHIVYRTDFSTILQPGEVSYLVDYPLPNLPEGEYWWRVRVELELPKGIRRYREVSTNLFQVKRC